MAWTPVTLKCSKCAASMDAINPCATCAKKEDQDIDVEIEVDENTAMINVRNLDQGAIGMPFFINNLMKEEGHDPTVFNSFRVTFAEE